MTANHPIPQYLIVGGALSWAFLLGLILLYAYTALSQEKFSLVLWLLPTASIAIFIPGMLVNSHRTYNWLCFAILPHFTVGVTNAMSPEPYIGDYFQVALSTCLFVSAMMTSRWLQAWQHQ